MIASKYSESQFEQKEENGGTRNVVLGGRW